MHLRSVLLGAALGFGAAWLLLARPWADEPAPAFDSPTEPAPTPAVSESAAAPRLQFVPAAPGSPRDRLTLFRSGSTREILDAVNARAPVHAAEAEVLLRRVDRARAEGDEDLFFAAVMGLSEAGTRRTKEKLHALLADESLRLPREIGWRFRRAFQNDGPADIAVLARMRYEQSGEFERPDKGWLYLIARHGTEADLDWLFEQAAFSPLIHCGRPAAAERLRPLLVEGRLPKDCYGGLARNHPELMFEHLPALIERDKFDPVKYRGSSTPPDLKTLFRAYGGAVPSDAVSVAKAFLLGQRDIRRQIATVYAVQTMSFRDLDVSGLEPLLLAPSYYLERLSVKSDSPVVREARRAIEDNRVAWSYRAVGALRMAGEKHADLLPVASKIESHLNSGWK